MTEKEQTFWGGFESNAHLNRFLIAIAVFFLALTGAIIIIFGMLGLNVKTAQFEISVSGETKPAQSLKKITLENTGLVFELDSGQKIANLLVPANQVWVDTKIDVPENSHVTITASGSANVSISRSIDISKNPAKYNPGLYNNLISPDGTSLNRTLINARPADEMRRGLRIDPAAAIGALLATVQSEDFDSAATPKPRAIFPLSRDGKTISFTAKSAGRLYLTVNDLLGSNRPEDKQLWLLARDISGRLLTPSEQADVVRRSYGDEIDVPKQLGELAKRWEDMVSQRYFNIFVEDNMGYYMVAISVEK